MSDGREASVADIGSMPAAGFQAEVPTVGRSVAVAERPAFMDIVPTDYKEKSWVQDIAKAEDPYSAFFKTYENAQSKIGEKAGGIQPLAADATPEQVKAYYKQLGAPDSFEGYDYNGPDLSKEDERIQKAAGAMRDDNVLKSMKEIALNAGLTTKQFNDLASAFDGLQVTKIKEMIAGAEGVTQKQIEAKRQTFNEIFGDKADKAEQISRDTAKKVFPESVQKSGDVEIALAYALNFINDKLYKNDTIATQAAAGAPAEDKASISAKIAQLRSTVDPATGKNLFRDTMNRKGDSIRAQVDELYVRLHAKE